MEQEDVVRVSPDKVEVLPAETPNEVLLKLMQNPSALRNLFQLNDQQAENVRALLAGGGTTLAVKMFSRYVGPELAGAVGGFLGGYVSRRLLGG